MHMKTAPILTLIKKYHLYLLFFVLLLIGFAHNLGTSLWDQDEAAYAGFARNMINSGNWLVPDFMWSDIHRKTPLHFWNIAISYKLFGVNEFSVRFPATMSILATYWLIFFWGKKFFGRDVALTGTIVLSTTLLVPAMGKISVTDGTLLLLSTACAFSVMEILRQKSLKAVLVFWASFALALLVKGPPVIIFTGGLAFLLVIFHPNRKNLVHLHPWFYMPLALLPLFTWGYLASLKDNGQFIDWLIDWYIVKRIHGSVLGQSAPPGAHLVYMAASFLPYLVFFPLAVRDGVRGLFKDKGTILFLGAWFVAGWLIYEFSRSKLPSYCLTAHVPLALLVGKRLVQYLENNTSPGKGKVITHFLIMILLSFGLASAAYFLGLSAGIQVSAMVLGVVLAIVAFKALSLEKPQQILYSILGANVVFQIVLWVVLLPQVDFYKNSTRRVSDFVRENAIKESTIILGNVTGHPPSLPFYLGHTFNNIIEEREFDPLMSYYREDRPVTLILNNHQKELFLESNPSLELKEFVSFFTDRKGKANYYVLMNEKSKKQGP